MIRPRTNAQQPTRMPPPRVAGAVLAAGLGLVALVTGRKPLHAVGRTWVSELRVDSPMPELGIPLLEDRGVHACTVRVSRAVGTPAGFWDVGGLALRIPEAGVLGRPADVLFATTGTGSLTRHVLRPVRHATAAPLTTLLPTRAAGRSIELLVRPGARDGAREDEEAREYELAICVERGPWDVLGLLRLLHEVPDARTRFDPIVDELEGMSTPAWVVAMREPAYHWARRLSRLRRTGASGELPGRAD